MVREDVKFRPRAVKQHIEGSVRTEDTVENGTNPRTVDLSYSDSGTVRLRRYICNSCGEDFTTPLDGVREKTPPGMASCRLPTHIAG